MSRIDRLVSIHPYFKVHPGKMDVVKGLLREFVACVAPDKNTIYYEFTISGDLVFCREAYVNAEALLAHVTSVGPALEKMLANADIARVEVHGPAAELEKLRGPLAQLNPTWFALECGVEH